MIRLLLFLLGVSLLVFLLSRAWRFKYGNIPKLVVLDRDGVINVDRSDYVKSVEEFQFIPGSMEAIRHLNDAKVKVIVATNQGGIGRMLYTREDLDLIHTHMQEELASIGAHIDHIFFCADHPDSPSHRRKPNPGMLEEALNLTAIPPHQAHMIGDSVRDMLSASKCDMHRHLVLTGHGEQSVRNDTLKEAFPVQIHENLLEAVHNILKH